MKLLDRLERIPWYWIGLFTGLALLNLSYFARKFDSTSHVVFYGGEYGAVAAALAQGRGFSDPFSLGTGATAWVSPLMPAIMAIVFFLTNLNATGSYWILLLIKYLSLGFGAGLIWDVLQRTRRGYAPLCYLWMALLGYTYHIEIFSLYHDEWLIFLVISLAFWSWHHRRARKSRIVLISAFSAAALCSPILWGALLIVMLIFNGPRYGAINESGGSGFISRPHPFPQNSLWIALSVSFFLILGWTLRNWVQVGVFAPIKSNAGYEIYQAQITSRNGVPDSSTFARHPIIFTAEEHQAYRFMGESAFIRERRDSAVRSIAAHPADFIRRVMNRFSNAFLFTRSPLNTAIVDSEVNRSDLERLRRAGFVEMRNNDFIWIDLDDPDKDLLAVLPSLGLTNPGRAADHWRSMSTGHYWYRFSWDRIIAGSLAGGLPWIAFLAAVLIRRRSKALPVVAWAALFSALYLIPYVLISHYLRYQIPLLGMQAILLTAGTTALLDIPENTSKAVQPEPDGTTERLI